MKLAALLRIIKWLPPLAMTIICANNAHAEKWYFEPTINLRLGYDDNVRFTTQFEESAFSSFLNADTRFGFRTEVSDVKFGVALDARRYEGQSDLNTDDQSISMDAAYRAELNKFQLETDFKRDSTRTSELLTTGFVSETFRRNALSLHPSWQRTLNERTSLQLGYSYSDIDYDDKAIRRGFVDYRYDVADLGVVYNLSEKTNFQASLGMAKYEADNIFSESTSYWIQLGLIYQFTERLSGTALIGPRHTDFDFQDRFGQKESSSDDGFIMDLSIAKKYETYTIEGGLSSSQTPSGSGTLLRTYNAKLKLHGALSERLNYSVGANFNRNESTSGFRNNQDRDYVVFEPRISWRATRWWKLTGSYRYRWQDRSGSDSETAVSNAIFINLHYVWPRESLSRWMEL